MKHFAKYSDALKETEAKAEQLWKAHPIVALGAVQTRDAITAFQMLDAFRPHGVARFVTTARTSFERLAKHSESPRWSWRTGKVPQMAR
jgi:hypothetical protein